MKPIPLSKVVKIAIICCSAGLLLEAIGIGIGGGNLIAGLIVIVAGWIVLIGTIVFWALFYRCPHCNGWLPNWYRNKYCPHCGILLK